MDKSSAEYAGVDGFLVDSFFTGLSKVWNIAGHKNDNWERVIAYIEGCQNVAFSSQGFYWSEFTEDLFFLRDIAIRHSLFFLYSSTEERISHYSPFDDIDEMTYGVPLYMDSREFVS